MPKRRKARARITGRNRQSRRFVSTTTSRSKFQLRSVAGILDRLDRSLGYAVTPVVTNNCAPRLVVHGDRHDAGDLLDRTRDRARALLAVHPDDLEIERGLGC